jgi:two-component system, cell cycle response regulator DivK
MPRLLYVEDNEMNRDMLSWRLQRRGFAGPGWMASYAPAQDTAGIPVIGLTAHAMVTDRDKWLEAGCDDYDTKPVELGRLLEKIERLLGTGAA